MADVHVQITPSRMMRLAPLQDPISCLANVENSQLELDRMDLDHHIFGLLIGELHLAPLTCPQKILDLGTGTGLWAMDAAEMYPSAEVIGTDLSPTQPNW